MAVGKFKGLLRNKARAHDGDGQPDGSASASDPPAELQTAPAEAPVWLGQQLGRSGSSGTAACDSTGCSGFDYGEWILPFQRRGDSLRKQ